MERLLSRGFNENAARILIAAAHLFGKKGYTATSVREIVKEADVTNPVLYYYFESKEGVFHRLLDVVQDALHSAIEEAISIHQRVQDRLEAIITALFAGLQFAPELIRFVYSVLFGPVQSRPDANIFAFQEKLHEMLCGVFEEAIDRGEFALRPKRTIEFLSDQFMGVVNNHMMFAFAILEFGPCSTQRDQLLNDYIGPDARRGLLDFFFHGAGTLANQETP
ncbi:TetR/AcrR family transcriptional regulator [Lujinxingia litoralis]|nr:TetR/AcrR family transcriptional regulator [Lujinxingia litoralis]